MRKQQGQGPSGGQWFSFDDNTVEPWDISKLDDECFGGRESESRAARGLPSSPRPLGVSIGPVCERCLEISMALPSHAEEPHMLTGNMTRRLVRLSNKFPVQKLVCSDP